MIKYTPAQEQEMSRMYLACETQEERDECVQELAERYEKSERMIIAKLSKMEIYKKKPTVSKVLGTKPETKESLVRKLEEKFGYQNGDFDGLEKAPKLVLAKLLE